MGGCTKEILLDVRRSLNVQFPLPSWVSISYFPGIPVPWILPCGKVGRGLSLHALLGKDAHFTHQSRGNRDANCSKGAFSRLCDLQLRPPILWFVWSLKTSFMCIMHSIYSCPPLFFNSLPPKLSPAPSHRSRSHNHVFFLWPSRPSLREPMRIQQS